MADGPEESPVSVTQADPVSAAQVRAAHAYASVLLEADVAGPAGAAAFLRTLGSGAKASASSAGDETLLALTRLMTAVSMPDRSSPEDRRRAVWASIGSASHCTCREAAALLATRANGNIQPRESTALDEHLATCAECRELSVRSAAADAAFRRALTPPGGGGIGGLSGGPRVGAALLLVLIAVAAGIYALSSSGSSRSNRASAAPVPAHTQTAEAIALTVPTVAAAATPHHRVHHAPRVKPALRHVTHHARTVTQPTPAVTVADSSPSTPSSAAAASSATSDATAAAPAAAAAPPATAATASPATTASAPSTAAQVSGPSSLPADSAPQQGIGSLTSTTP
jgi:hypothetical protein